MVDERHADCAPRPQPRLSQRERDVVALVACGLRNGEIASQLGIAEATAATHVRRAKHKLGIGSRVLLAIAIGGPPERRPADAPLTGAERDVAELARAGLSNGEIARRRGVSRYTIKNQLAAIYDKLGIASRTELAWMLTPACTDG